MTSESAAGNDAFDRAAMVIKFSTEPDEIYFIECSKETGVAVKSFSQMKHTINQLYKKIVFRHIEWSRPESALEILMQFVDDTQGCQYDAPIGKLLRKTNSPTAGSGDGKSKGRLGSLFSRGDSDTASTRDSVASDSSGKKSRFGSLFGRGSVAQEDARMSIPVGANILSNNGKPRLVQPGRTFFSSELVIKALKCVGLIQTDEAASNWLPSDLAEAKNKINLVPGAKLGHEQLLILDNM